MSKKKKLIIGVAVLLSCCVIVFGYLSYASCQMKYKKYEQYKKRGNDFSSLAVTETSSIHSFVYKLCPFDYATNK